MTRAKPLGRDVLHSLKAKDYARSVVGSRQAGFATATRAFVAALEEGYLDGLAVAIKAIESEMAQPGLSIGAEMALERVRDVLRPAAPTAPQPPKEPTK